MRYVVYSGIGAAESQPDFVPWEQMAGTSGVFKATPSGVIKALKNLRGQGAAVASRGTPLMSPVPVLLAVDPSQSTDSLLALALVASGAEESLKDPSFAADKVTPAMADLVRGDGKGNNVVVVSRVEATDASGKAVRQTYMRVFLSVDEAKAQMASLPGRAQHLVLNESGEVRAALASTGAVQPGGALYVPPVGQSWWDSLSSPMKVFVGVSGVAFVGALAFAFHGAPKRRRR